MKRIGVVLLHLQAWIFFCVAIVYVTTWIGDKLSHAVMYEAGICKEQVKPK